MQIEAGITPLVSPLWTRQRDRRTHGVWLGFHVDIARPDLCPGPNLRAVGVNARVSIDRRLQIAKCLPPNHDICIEHLGDLLRLAVTLDETRQTRDLKGVGWHVDVEFLGVVQNFFPELHERIINLLCHGERKVRLMCELRRTAIKIRNQEVRCVLVHKRARPQLVGAMAARRRHRNRPARGLRARAANHAATEQQRTIHSSDYQHHRSPRSRHHQSQLRWP